ncbi:MAG: hypothetical protein KKH51_00135 [Actinobacteria bacterium]|nr:hypothetical protein [Actinomycetota bacterium]
MTYAPAVEAAPPAVKRRNVPGIIGFIFVMLAYATPLLAGVFGFIVASQDPTGLFTDASWAWLSALFWAFIGVVIGGIIAAVGLILGIVSLFVKFAGRVLGILAIVFGSAPVLALLVILVTGGLSSVGQ